jgi:hypothetical protein
VERLSLKLTISSVPQVFVNLKHARTVFPARLLDVRALSASEA